MHRVTGVVQHYPWGHPTFLPELLRHPPDGRPWAELWLGTHPNGPTTLDDGRPLAEVTGGDLPYLLKVLSAARPLSLQTHPDRERAQAGHAAGRYPDPNPKPELLCALTPFDALCGIRPLDATVELLDELHLRQLANELHDSGPRSILERLYRGELDPLPVVEACRSSSRPEAELVVRLADRYPDDPSVVATLLLNLVSLAPGEAISLPAGNLHAYVGGSGIELMGASDNVVRGGLTDKHVDVDELLAVVDTTPLPDPVMARSDRYRLPGDAATLIALEPGHEHTSTGHELAVDLDGGCWYLAPGERLTATAATFVAVAGAA